MGSKREREQIDKVYRKLKKTLAEKDTSLRYLYYMTYHAKPYPELSQEDDKLSLSIREIFDEHGGGPDTPFEELTGDFDSKIIAFGTRMLKEAGIDIFR